MFAEKSGGGWGTISFSILGSDMNQIPMNAGEIATSGLRECTIFYCLSVLSFGMQGETQSLTWENGQ